jgi:hypothetical protein
MGELAQVERARLRLEESRAIDEIVERFSRRYMTREVDEKVGLVKTFLDRFESSEPVPDRQAFKQLASGLRGFVSEVLSAAIQVLNEIDALLIMGLVQESRRTWTEQISSLTGFASQLAAADVIIDKEAELEEAGYFEVEVTAEGLLHLLRTDDLSKDKDKDSEIKESVTQRRSLLEQFIATSTPIEDELRRFDTSPRALGLVARLGELRSESAKALWAARISRYGAFSPWTTGSLVSVLAGLATWGAAGVVAPLLSLVGLLKRYQRGARLAWACLLIGILESAVAWKLDVPGRVSTWISSGLAPPAVAIAASSATRNVTDGGHEEAAEPQEPQPHPKVPNATSTSVEANSPELAVPVAPAVQQDPAEVALTALWKELERADALIGSDLDGAIRISKIAIAGAATPTQASPEDLWSSHFQHPSPEGLKRLLGDGHKLNQKTPYGIEGHAQRVEQHKSSDPSKAAGYMNSIVFLCSDGFDLEAWWVQHYFHLPPDLPGVDMSRVCPSLRKGHGKR